MSVKRGVRDRAGAGPNSGSIILFRVRVRVRLG